MGEDFFIVIIQICVDPSKFVINCDRVAYVLPKIHSQVLELREIENLLYPHTTCFRDNMLINSLLCNYLAKLINLQIGRQNQDQIRTYFKCVSYNKSQIWYHVWRSHYVWIQTFLLQLHVGRNYDNLGLYIL